MTNKDGNGGTPTHTRKRKGKGIVIEEPQPQPPPQQQFRPSPSPLPLPLATQNNSPLINTSNNPQQPRNIFSYHPPGHNVGQSSSSSQVQRILNAAAPVGPFSFTSLLTAPYSQIEGYYHNFVDQAEIDKIIKLHSENLKQALAGVLEKQQNAAEERAAKKLKEKEVELQVKCSQNAELESMIEFYKRDAAESQYRIMSLQNTVNSLRAELRDVMDSVVDSSSSSSSSEESSEEANTVRLDCRICETEMANVLFYPCRHICVCVGCDLATNACPVCGRIKTSSVNVFFP